MFPYPRFSYRCPKLAARDVCAVPVLGTSGVRAGVRVRGMVPGWVIRVGNTGVYYPATLLEGEVSDSEAGPVTPLQGGWSGWSLSSERPVMPGPPLPAVGPAPLS